MTMRARVVGACSAVLAIALGLWLYLQWPRWYGTEVLLPVELKTEGAAPGAVVASYPDARLQLDASNTLEATGKTQMPRITVRSVGVVWDSRHDPTAEAASLRSRTVYVQVKTIDKTTTMGEALSHVVSISTTLVPEAINLRVQVTATNPSAQINLGIAGGRLPLAADTALAQAAAILKVLPSGRHAIVGVIAGGKRIYFF